MDKHEFWKLIERHGKQLTIDALQGAKRRIDRIIERKVSAMNTLRISEGEKVLVLGASILDVGDDVPAIVAELKENGVRVLLPGEDSPLGRFGYDRLRRLTDQEYGEAVLAYANRLATYNAQRADD